MTRLQLETQQEREWQVFEREHIGDLTSAVKLAAYEIGKRHGLELAEWQARANEKDMSKTTHTSTIREYVKNHTKDDIAHFFEDQFVKKDAEIERLKKALEQVVYGAREVLGDVANISHAINMLESAARKARGYTDELQTNIY